MTISSSSVFAPSGFFQFPRGSQILLYGPPGTVKTSFALKYLADRISLGEHGVYATTNLTPSQVTQYVPEAMPGLQIVDGVSCTRGAKSTETFAFRSLSELNSVSRVLVDAIQEFENNHLCIDSLSTLMVYSEPYSVLRFLQVMSAKAKIQGVTSLYVLEEGVHDSTIVESLRFCVDGAIQTCDIEVNERLVNLVRMEYVRGTTVDSRWLQISKDMDLILFSTE